VEELLWRVEPCVDIAEVHFWLSSIVVNPGIRRNVHTGNDLEMARRPSDSAMLLSFTLDLFSRFRFLIDREQDVGQRNSPFTYLVIKIRHRRLHADPHSVSDLGGREALVQPGGVSVFPGH